VRAVDAGPPQRLRVLHVAQSVAGGVASYLEELCGYQTARFGSNNVRFLVPVGSEGHLAAVDPIQLAPFSSVDRSPAALIKFAKAANAEIRRFKPDVVHLHSSFAGALRLSMPLRWNRPRIIYCPHGWAFGMDVPRGKKRVYAAVERLLARRTDAIIVVSADENRLAMEFGLPPDRTRVVKSGVAWAPPIEKRSRTGPLRLAFIGRFDRQKGIDILLDTLRRFALPQVEFEIVGANVVGEDPVELSEVPGNLHFHGWLPRARTLDLLNSVDALVMPSRWEAFGLTAIEAMRASVPVIASNRGALPEVVQHGVGGYIFDLDNRDALGRTLASLTREMLELIGATARGRWEREFVAERMNELTVSAYYEVLGVAPVARDDEAASDFAAEVMVACDSLETAS
jgi:glycosyltransferase involved in cell wall biosynthesis